MVAVERGRPARGAATANTPTKPRSRVHQGTGAQAASTCPVAASTTQTAVNTAALNSRGAAPACATGAVMAALIIALGPGPA